MKESEFWEQDMQYVDKSSKLCVLDGFECNGSLGEDQALLSFMVGRCEQVMFRPGNSFELHVIPLSRVSISKMGSNRETRSNRIR